MNDLELLTQAKEKAHKRLLEESTVENIKAWRAADKALKDYLDKNSSDENPESASLPNILAVVEYLQDQGWKVSKSAAYQHQKAGKIRLQEDGTFRIKDIEKYAATFLKRLDGQTDFLDDLECLQKEKLAAETDKAKAQAAHWELKTKIENGQYVELELFEREIAARAKMFKADLENFCRSQAMGIIECVKGDHDLAPDLIDFMLEQVEIFLDRYAKQKEIKKCQEV